MPPQALVRADSIVGRAEPPPPFDCSWTPDGADATCVQFAGGLETAAAPVDAAVKLAEPDLAP